MTTQLSDRQAECLRWVGEGKTSAEIATIMSLSEHTVVDHIRNASEKLGAVNRAHAAVLFDRTVRA